MVDSLILDCFQTKSYCSILCLFQYLVSCLPKYLGIVAQRLFRCIYNVQKYCLACSKLQFCISIVSSLNAGHPVWEFLKLECAVVMRSKHISGHCVSVDLLLVSLLQPFLAPESQSHSYILFRDCASTVWHSAQKSLNFQTLHYSLQNTYCIFFILLLRSLGFNLSHFL